MTQVQPTEAPAWTCRRATVIRGAVYPRGATFVGDPERARAKVDDLSPANNAARRWRPASERTATPRPRWRALCMLENDRQLVQPNMMFFCNEWPRGDDREPYNETAAEVLRYYQEHKDDPRLPLFAWDDNNGCTNTVEHAERPAPVEPPLDLRPPYANGDFVFMTPPQARAPDPRQPHAQMRRKPSSYTPDAFPSAPKLPPREFSHDKDHAKYQR
jgi:hypothetical protein